MAKNPQIFVEYVAKTEQLAKASADVEKSGGRIKNAFGGVKGAIASGLAVGAVVAFGKSCVAAATESGVATKRLENIFKSMGDTTGKAAKAAEDYASSLSKKIGVDDDEIIKGQALLATFGAVSNATARQAGIFDRATKAGADLAAAGFGTLDSNAVQLGKALQDPIKGLTALGRSGVTFTAQEKERIKTLVESNKVTEAQKLVLQAVEKQVGGTAEATATAGQKAAVAFGEFQETLGGLLVPVINTLTPLLTGLVEIITPLTPILVPLGIAIGGVVLAVKAWAAAQKALALVMEMNPWILAITAVIVAIVLLVKHWNTVKAVVVAVLDTIRRAFSVVVNFIRDHWQTLVAILAGPLGVAVLAIVKHWNRIKDAVGTVVGAIKTAWNGVLSFLASTKDKFGAIAQGIANVLKAPINAFIGAWNRLGIPAFHIKVPLAPDINFGGWHVPQIPKLAAGAVVSRPTLAMVGEGAGREIVAPESLLRQIVNERPLHVRVFIGDTELRGMVRAEVTDANTGLARTLLTGARA